VAHLALYLTSILCRVPQRQRGYNGANFGILGVRHEPMGLASESFATLLSRALQYLISY
jgi:hypothetical protein